MNKCVFVLLLVITVSCNYINNNSTLENSITSNTDLVIIDTIILNKKIVVKTNDNQYSIIQIGDKYDTLNFSLKDLVVSSNENTDKGAFIVNGNKFQNVPYLISDSFLFIPLIDTAYFVNGVLLSINLRHSEKIILSVKEANFPFLINKYAQFFVDTVRKEIAFANKKLEESSENYSFSIFSYGISNDIRYKTQIQFLQPFIRDDDDFKNFINALKK